MRRLWILLGPAALITALAGCEGMMHQTRATAPTVTYTYGDRDDYDEIEEMAEDYCDDNYDADAYLVEEYRVEGGGYEATFSCE